VARNDPPAGRNWTFRHRNGIMTAGRSPRAGKLGRIARAIQQEKRTLSSKFEQSVAIKLSAKMPFFAGH
jgi:hypothetical protein